MIFSFPQRKNIIVIQLDTNFFFYFYSTVTTFAKFRGVSGLIPLDTDK
jgi:hypothetical protein